MEPGQSYHIYNHANGSEDIFREEENYRFFMQQYAKYLGDVVDTCAYCLLPNHFHFLLGVRSKEELEKTFPKFETLEKLVSKQFSNFFSSYTQSFNKVYERKGSLFLKNFKRKPILTASQWQETFLYIHLNPVKHGFSTSVIDWKWSSWHAYKHLEKKSLLERTYYMNFFDGMSHVNDMMEIKRESILNKNLEMDN
ncbi:transposase [Echinicola marina]|uniref:transposase n=1 Tax=Echinicola marina TaxID=2859768 RepID=UPI001CF61862|nr:transposase [Echinicola marina]UCS91855.1 transposase [Echinicola marina]